MNQLSNRFHSVIYHDARDFCVVENDDDGIGGGEDGKKKKKRREKMGENCARDKRQEVLARRPIKVLLKYRYMLCSRLYVYMAIISLVYK